MAETDTPPSDPEQASAESKRQRGSLMLEMLGRAIVAWSYAEQTAEFTLDLLLGCNSLPEEECTIIATTVDSRDRASLIAALGYRLLANEPWFEGLIATVSHLSNDLRNRRNRLLHDAWSKDEDVLSRRSSSKPKLARPQAHKLELILPSFEPVTADEIADFTQACLDVAKSLNIANRKILAFGVKRRRA